MPAESHQRAVARVDAARDRYFGDRVGHARVGDLDEARGNAVAVEVVTLGSQTLHERIERTADGLFDERKREVVGLHTAQRKVAIRQRGFACQRPTRRVEAPVTDRPRNRGSALGSDEQAHAVEAAERAAPGGDAMDPHHRRLYPHARNEGLEAAVDFARAKQRYVGRRPAHVEPDSAIEARGGRDASGPDHPPGRPREQRSRPPEALGGGQPAR